MTKPDLPTIDTLHKLLRYEPKTGKLFWRKRDVAFFTDGKQAADHNAFAWNNKHAGNEALTSDSCKNYLCGRIFRKHYFAHRVIWAIAYDKWPTDQIDHINHDKKDNRIENLREVTNQENHKNLPRSLNNTSGVTGVHWIKQTSKWRAQICVEGSYKNLGYFIEKSEAITVRAAAELKYGFHKNHGEAAK